VFISFAWTSEAYLNGLKTCTRRDWKESHFQQWVKAYRAGNLVHDAWSNLPFVAGAEKIGRFRLTCEPYREPLADMPVEDLVAEGGLWESKAEFIRLQGGAPNKELVVVRFIPLGIDMTDVIAAELERTYGKEHR
jgi:hypothetical protein